MSKEVENALNVISSQLMRYKPFNEQEEKDKAIILDYLNSRENLFTRENEKVHFSSSAWVLNEDLTKVLMVHHNIYNSWVFPGGHVEEVQENLIDTAIREVKEETGVENVNVLLNDIFGIEVIPIKEHYRRGKFVPAHTHIDFVYLLQVSECETLKMQELENSGVRWFDIVSVLDSVEDKWFRDVVFNKLVIKSLMCIDGDDDAITIVDNIYSSEF